MRRFFVTAAKLTVSLILIAVVLRKVGVAAIAEGAAEIGFFWLSLALALSVVFILARSAKWWMVARLVVPDLTYQAALFSLVGGMGLGMVTPGRAGEFTRVAFLATRERMPLLGLFAVDRVLDLLSIVALGALAAAALGYSTPALLGSLAFLAGLAFLVGLRPGRDLLTSVAERLGAGALVRRLLDGTANLDRRRLLWWTIVAIFATAIGYLQFFVLLRSLGEAPFLATCMVFSALILSNLLPISIAGLGVREGLSAVLLPQFGVEQSAAVNAAFLSFVTNTVLPGIAGALLYVRLRAQIGSSSP